MRTLFAWIKNLWQGEEPLWKAYWMWGCLLGNGLAFALNAVVPAGQAEEVSTARVVAALALLPLMLVWLVVTPVAIWRCAPNTNSGWWTFLARFSVVISFSVPLLKFLMRLQQPM